MGAHIFRVGDLVRLRNPGLAAPGNAYEVRQRLAAAPDGDLLYRVKYVQELHDRIVKESELTPAAAPPLRRYRGLTGSGARFR